MPVTLELRRPFTRADALAAGISPAMLRGSRFRRIFRGVYVDARVPAHPLLAVEAALVLHPPGAFASHSSAAHAYGVPLPVLSTFTSASSPQPTGGHVPGSCPTSRHRIRQ